MTKENIKGNTGDAARCMELRIDIYGVMEETRDHYGDADLSVASVHLDLASVTTAARRLSKLHDEET